MNELEDLMDYLDDTAGSSLRAVGYYQEDEFELLHHRIHRDHDILLDRLRITHEQVTWDWRPSVSIHRSQPGAEGWPPPTGGRCPNQVALDGTMIRVDDQAYWLYAATDPDPDEFLHVDLYMMQNFGASLLFLGELKEKHNVADAVFLVDGAQWLKEALRRHGLQFHHVTHGNRNAIERLYKKSNAEPASSPTTSATPIPTP